VSDATVSDTVDSDHLPLVLHILDQVKIRNLLEPTEKFPDWYWLESLTSELISLNIEINSGAEADKVARNFTASVASAYRLLTSNVTLSDINSDLPDLDHLLKHKQRLRKFWQETRDAACKTAVNWVMKSIWRITRKMALEQWGKKNRYH
jgi:hypothetical protein